MGFEYVFVNGMLALEHDKVTGQIGGRPLRGPGYIMRDYLPEGLPPRGKVQGVVTDEGGWPLPRATVTLTDAAGKVVGTAHIQEEWPLRDCAGEAVQRLLVEGRAHGFRNSATIGRRLQRLELAVVWVCARSEISIA